MPSDTLSGMGPCCQIALTFASWGWWGSNVLLPFALGALASGLVVGFQLLAKGLQLRCAGKRFVGTWDQYLYANPNPPPGKCEECKQAFPAVCEKCRRELPAPRPLPLVRDEGECTIRIETKHPMRGVLRLKAEHLVKEEKVVDGARVVQAMKLQWEGDVVIDRGVHTRAVIAWAYTRPPDIDFGAYQLLAHDHGELFMFPAVPPVPGDYPKFILKRVK